ncbi:1-(5-phosphoribosyl)-5-[(5-phosphoribosylamino)methylideneamino] imidazole-4-carboxamide isomerase [Heyndrickxia shackletonii]|uniref:1-(5-phosphoribosyl)-5-[(5-phosphoribosylamino)methylideneamino] imidazole-4-carboxamide isomerase n=1 Tax=Heyndrickxia shackletonii TaxID=157838 RepID=A0A0Q3TIW5_9BACI|nr:1-(5-phosphoribosyl)-5-[(5-phosphoribosylamino)methylideneamino]imidazole-4-carboxamide isomerase [Heyndrickxia shackletonii]KQL53880.1 1-(5-phosphoribosyl)-5-[(5-phosphoribosylamino)methylideneamino] imidazole-4-carboxamide isomerase [Heyndrickxia shackletonii]MBB2478962.1 1-(5-phosphoribosyl)-5-[(5-phosphoribosylamino)methylideneamino]imidazole-4-carboxamide isomerase [Bacillus sp. APMAM]NEY97846.1 1-(5-phosphoribosyl)-5-[(5-phosphoribosylamino)methylideneamino]imidazole-4-carboxamide isome
MTKVIPAIDLIDGKCVRLFQGDFNKSTVMGNDPEIQLQKFIEDGAGLIHIVDLDGARLGAPKQFELISNLAKISSVPIQVGGGIRSIETIEKYIKAGVSRLVLGTAAMEDEAFLKGVLKNFSDQVAVGIDAKNEKVATRGWETVVDVNYIDFAKNIEELGAKTIIFTDISRDGTLTGPNLEQLHRLNEAVQCHIIASGGIRNQHDLEALDVIGVAEAIVGKALYDGMIKLSGVVSR